MSINFIKEQWEDILNKTRETYINSIKTITLQQKQIEKIISYVIKQYNNLTQDQINYYFTYIESIFKEREKFILEFKAKLFENLLIMPNIEDIIFKKNFNEIFTGLKELYENFFKKTF